MVDNGSGRCNEGRSKTAKKAKETQLFTNELEARIIRNKTAKKLKHSKKDHQRTKMEHQDQNLPDSWAALGEYLGWRKPMTYIMLTEDGKVLT